MSLYSYKEFTPQIGKSCFIAPDATVIGRVHLEEGANIWFNAVLRGDVNIITIGRDTNVQDLSMLHVTEEEALSIGSGVTIGHSVVLHSCTIEDNCLIGMGSIVLDGAVIGKNSLVGAGSVCPPNKVYPPNSLILGNPAKVVRELRPEELDGYGNHYKSYTRYRDEFLDPKIFRQVDSPSE